ncbi:hypothetical protein KY363_04705 [Candidatus Woesearchaeota archaeon]|nr:hypothetical protein [Candidatus Woesearchaeota archaeon]
MEQVQYIGLKDLEHVDQLVVEKIVAEYFPRIKRKLHNETSLVVHLKSYSKGGHRPKYSIHIRAIAPTRSFETNKTHEWDVSNSMHHAFDDLMRQIEHGFHDQKGKGGVREWFRGWWK